MAPVCSQCGRAVEPEQAVTLFLRNGTWDPDLPPAGWVMTNLASFHEDCWARFERDHRLAEALEPPKKA